jgi:hypothetical protein
LVWVCVVGAVLTTRLAGTSVVFNQAFHCGGCL